MAKFLVVATRGQQGTWAVYSQDDSPRAPGTVAQVMGPIVGSVASWDDLAALVEKQGVASHQVTGAGLDQMEQVLGPQQDS